MQSKNKEVALVKFLGNTVHTVKVEGSRFPDTNKNLMMLN